MPPPHNSQPPNPYRSAAALAGGLMVLVFLGCMSISIGGPSDVRPGDAECFVQEGKVHLLPNGSELVYYPIPFAHTPNLELCGGFFENEWNLVEQQEDHFRIASTSKSATGTWVSWKARGLKATQAAPAVPPPVPPPSPETLPAAPVPLPSNP